MDDRVSLVKPRRTVKIQGWYHILMIGFVAVLVGGANLVWTYEVDNRSEKRRDAVERQADQRWCSLLNFVVGVQGQTPLTDVQRQYLELINGLRSELNC